MRRVRHRAAVVTRIRDTIGIRIGQHIRHTRIGLHDRQAMRIEAVGLAQREVKVVRTTRVGGRHRDIVATGPAARRAVRIEDAVVSIRCVANRRGERTDYGEPHVVGVGVVHIDHIALDDGERIDDREAQAAEARFHGAVIVGVQVRAHDRCCAVTQHVGVRAVLNVRSEVEDGDRGRGIGTGQDDPDSVADKEHAVGARGHSAQVNRLIDHATRAAVTVDGQQPPTGQLRAGWAEDLDKLLRLIDTGNVDAKLRHVEGRLRALSSRSGAKGESRDAGGKGVLHGIQVPCAVLRTLEDLIETSCVLCSFAAKDLQSSCQGDHARALVMP